MTKLFRIDRRLILIALCALGVSLFMDMIPHAALAQTAPAGTCTTDPAFQIPPYAEGKGLISTIVTNIETILKTISQTLYTTIIQDGGFKYAVNAAVSLYIVMYGILFTFGMVQITIFDFVMRMIKIGFIALLLSSTSWTFFDQHVIHFFNDGTNCLIDEITRITTGNTSPAVCSVDNPGQPFVSLDSAITKAVSAKMAVTLQAMAFTGPFGFMYCALLLMCLGSFIKALLTALWVYLMSLVLRTLLFGLAPIFLVCLLFNRTRNLFDGWLNQVVNACLQPILLFIFFAFFAKLIEASIDQILYVPVCWTEAADSLRGTPSRVHFWRYSVLNSSNNYEPYGGGWTFTGPQNAPGDGRIFPIDIVAILVFFMLSQLANRFNGVVLMVARELAGATTDLSTMQGALSEWFSGSKAAGESISNLSGSRPGLIPGLANRSSTGGPAPRSSQEAAQQAGSLSGVRQNPSTPEDS